MNIDVLVIGQGISGTFLHWQLQKAGLSSIIIDEPRANSASKAAAGIINPVTGRRIVKTWMIDELLPYIDNVYTQIGRDLDIQCISQKNIVDFFPTPQMRNAFFLRYEEDKEYLNIPMDENDRRSYFNYDFGYGEIEPCYLIDVIGLLEKYRQKIAGTQQLLEEKFDIEKLQLYNDAVSYNDITAGKIIFCDGIESFNNPYFKNLPFAPNKGEALIIESKDLPTENIFKKGINIVPWKEGLFWVGSSYQWEFENEKPSDSFRQQTEGILKHWLKIPFKITDHFAAIRPATVERRPFVGFHPHHKNLGILNGMGTKGCSLAPFFAEQLANHLIKQSAIMPEATIQRFARVLSR